MGVDNVDILEVETLQGVTKAFDDVFTGQAVVVDEDLAICATLVQLKMHIMRLCDQICRPGA